MENDAAVRRPGRASDGGGDGYSGDPEEGRWDGSAAEPPGFDWADVDAITGAADSADQAAPGDDAEPTAAMIAELSERQGSGLDWGQDAPKAAGSPFARRGVAQARAGTEALVAAAVAADLDGEAKPEHPVEPAADSAASISKALAVLRLGKNPQTIASRLDYYLGMMSPAESAATVRFMHDFKMQPNDPEAAIPLMMGHLRAIAQTIPAAIDAAAAGMGVRLQSSLTDLNDLIKVLEDALAKVREDAANAAEIARQSVDERADSFVTELGTALREAAFKAAEIANGAVVEQKTLAIAAIAKESEEQLESVERNINGIALRAASEIVKMVEAKMDGAKPANHEEVEKWKTAALALGGFVAGLAAMGLFALARSKGWI